jgi:hypothetical protein
VRDFISIPKATKIRRKTVRMSNGFHKTLL